MLQMLVGACMLADTALRCATCAAPSGDTKLCTQPEAALTRCDESICNQAVRVCSSYTLAPRLLQSVMLTR